MTTAELVHAKVRTYPRTLWFLGFGMFINLVGLSFLWPITSIYIHEQLGRPLTVAGVVLFLYSAAGAVGNLTGGWLYDRVGGRPVLLASALGSTVSIGLLGFFESWPLYVTVMIIYGFTIALCFPVVSALAVRAWPAGGRQVFNFIYVANNIGVAVGTALGGVLAAHSYRLAFLGAAVTAAMFGLLAFLFIHDRATEGDMADDAASAPVPTDAPPPWTPIVALFVALVTFWLVYVQFQSIVSVHMEKLGIGLTRYSLLWTINGVVIVAGQPLLAVGLRFIRSTAAQLYLGTLLYLGAFGLLLTSNQYPIFVGSMVVLTVGEMLLWPGVPAAVARLAPPARRGFFQGFIASAATFGRMLGPLMGGMLYDRWGYAPTIGIMLSLLVVPLACITIYTRTGNVTASEAVSPGAAS